MTSKPTPPINKPDAGIYRIPCSDCEKAYFGETSRSLDKRVYEHKRAIKTGDSKNAIFTHMHKYQHRPNFSNSHIIKYIHNRRQRQIVESAIISVANTVTQRPGFYCIAHSIAQNICYEQKLKINLNLNLTPENPV